MEYFRSQIFIVKRIFFRQAPRDEATADGRSLESALDRAVPIVLCSVSSCAACRQDRRLLLLLLLRTPATLSSRVLTVRTTTTRQRWWAVSSSNTHFSLRFWIF